MGWGVAPVTLRCLLVMMVVTVGEHGHFIWPTSMRREGGVFWGVVAGSNWQWVGLMKSIADFLHCVCQLQALTAMVQLCFNYYGFLHDFVDSLGSFPHEFVKGVFDIS